MAELVGTYEAWLVAISVAVAMLSSFVALATVQRIYCSSNAKWDTLWSITFGISMGTGIWSMHFIGMLAFELPVADYYDLGLTAASFLLTVVLCAIAVFPLRKGGDISKARIVGTGTLLGCGIAGMHYTGMAAMRINADIHYSPGMIALSVLLAIATSSVALYIVNHLKAMAIFSQWRLKLSAAAVMGLAVSCMHYTAMHGASFTALPEAHNYSDHIHPQFMAITVIIVTVLIQGGTLLVALLDEAYFTAKTSEQLAQQSSEMDQALFSVLAVTLENRPLPEILERILDTLLNVEWLRLEDKGAIFLADGRDRRLHLTASRHLPPAMSEMCADIEFGACLCGQAAQTKKIAHKGSIDRDDCKLPECASPHGHYCVPIMDEGALLGVLNLYAGRDHETEPMELRFLESVSNAMAGIIRRKMLEERLKKLSYEDELTELPNRRRFTEELTHALNLAGRAGSRLAVMMLDLDRFKPVNDNFGHDVGDLLLRQVADRVRDCLREMDTFARIGGDEFIILLEMVQEPGGVKVVGKRILDTLCRPFDINGHRIEIGGSIGVAFYPDDARMPEELIKRADIALYKAKEHRGSMQVSGATATKAVSDRRQAAAS